MTQKNLASLLVELLTEELPPKALARPKGETLSFGDKEEWRAWLASHHATAPGVGLRIAKKGARATTVTYAEAVEVALAWGWIDGSSPSCTLA